MPDAARGYSPVMQALAIIDMQRWMFRYPERAAQLPSLVENVNRLSNAFAAKGLPVFDIRTVHKADRSSWSRLMRKYDYACLIEGTEGADYVDGYTPPRSAIGVLKTANSAFLGTDFEAELRASGVTELVLAGVFGDGCVGLTAAEAAQRRFEVVLVGDAIGHSRADRSATIIDWLVEDYELRLLDTEKTISMCSAPTTTSGRRT
jgi:nicotinamidase-related amidase